MNTTSMPRHVHFVGSVPLASAKEVFEKVSSTVGTLAPRIPDGETGDRSQWIVCQTEVMGRTPNLHKSSEKPMGGGKVAVIYQIMDRSQPVNFGPLGYAREAKKSYLEFKALKQAGEISPKTRFQVSLPTPLAVLSAFIELDAQALVEPSYEAQMLAEIREIAAAVPPEELAIQWDVCMEVFLLEGVPMAKFFDSSKENMLSRLIALGNVVPEGVELGYHICYGDMNHKHAVQPKNLGLCVEISNRIFSGVKRQVQWIHMPVPQGRSDEAYFAPLAGLKRPAGAEIYLGLIHHTDGVAGAKTRIQSANRFIQDFGVATECGFGRRPPGTIPDLLALHHEVACIS